MTQAELLKNLADPGHDVTGHVGWYLNPSTGLCKRQGGHFVAFQGTDGNTVSLQDSSPRSGGRLTEGVRLITRSGIFKKKSEQETRADQIQLDGIAARKYGDTSALGILDGIFKWGVEKKRS